MSDKHFLLLIAEDKQVISYRPRFAALTDNALAAILLQQMIYWWKQVEGRPFYKFRAPCQHKLYLSGQSWTEELEWSVHEFDSALKVIGTKITHGVSKQSILSAKLPERAVKESVTTFRARLTAALKCMVLYWTDASRVTWYLPNADLLGKCISRIYLDKSYGLRYLVTPHSVITQQNAQSGVTLSSSETTTEITSETTSENKAAVVASTATTATPIDSNTEYSLLNTTPSSPTLEVIPQSMSALPAELPPTPLSPPSPEQQTLWEAAWFQFEHQCDRASFEMYGRGAQLLGVEGNTFVIQARTIQARTMLQGRFYRNLQRIMSDCGASGAEIRFVLPQVSAPPPPPENGAAPPDHAMPTQAEIAAIMTLYAEEIGKLTRLIGEDISDTIQECGIEAVRYGISEAVRANVRNWRYAQKIAQSHIGMSSQQAETP